MKKIFIINGLLLLILLSGCATAPKPLRIYSGNNDGAPFTTAKETLDTTMKKICQKEHGKISYGKWGDHCVISKGCTVYGNMSITHNSRRAAYGKNKIASTYYEFKNTGESENCSNRLDGISKQVFHIQNETIRSINLKIDEANKARIKQQKQEQEKQALAREKEQEKQAKMALERKKNQEKEVKLALIRKKEHDAICQKTLLEIEKSSGFKQIDLYKRLDQLNCE
jgi:hypothetical protein